MRTEPLCDGTPEAIDIYHHKVRYPNELEQLMRDERLTLHNRQIIERFLTDARLGKTVKKGAKKRLTVSRCRKLLYTLKRAAMLLDVPLDAVTVERMQWLVIGMEDGTILKSHAAVHGPDEPYAKETATDMKRVLRKFYRWLFRDDVKRFEELTDWFDTRENQTNVQAFGLEQAQQLARAIGAPQGRALVMLLFDGGLRSGELFNVRLRDVTFRPDSNGQDTCFIRIRVSKTIPRTVSLPLATDEVRFWLERHPAKVRIRQNGTIDVMDINAPLITWSYHYTRKLLRKLGEDELGIHLYVHKLRHCSATYYGQFLTEYQMCARYGWTIGSDVPRRYVQLSRLMGAETASMIRSRATGLESSAIVPEVIEPRVHRPGRTVTATPTTPEMSQMLSDPRVVEVLQRMLLERALVESKR